MKKISIAIVDDHKLVREMWKILLKEKPELELAGESGELNDAIPSAPGLPCYP